ncbi:MAG: shikimate kinase [Eubacteriales bacterium]|nr:shikimate kinase [Eubacteriales bacterium]
MSVTNSARYGLLGYPLGHSLSPQIHHRLIARAGLSGSYELLPTAPENLQTQLRHLIQDFDGFNITIPYKQDVMSVLDQIDPLAQQIGAVNTVVRNAAGQTIGYNTDLEGFLADAPELANQRVLILGAGGVSRTLAFAAAMRGAKEILILARNLEKANRLAAAVLACYPNCPIAITDEPNRAWSSVLPDAAARWVILNGTPLGMWPKMGALPISEAIIAQAQAVYDTIYNPYATKLVLIAQAHGIPAKTGLGMLVNQAILAQQRWNPQAEISLAAASEIAQELTAEIYRHSPLTLILVGFMGSGKSRLGRELAASLGWPLIDLDAQVEKAAKRTIPELFATAGEPAFRLLERTALDQALQAEHCQILATGGGALLSPEAQSIVRAHPALVIYLDASLQTIEHRVGDGAGRPLIAGGERERLAKLYEIRRPIYATIADLTIDADQALETKLKRITSILGLGGKT